jgi:hypothetical protein
MIYIIIKDSAIKNILFKRLNIIDLILKNSIKLKKNSVLILI